MNARKYRHLDAPQVVETVDHLVRRVRERFPTSNLGTVAAELLLVAREAAARSTSIRRPHYGLRFLIAALLLAGAGGIGISAARVIGTDFPWAPKNGPDLVEEINNVIGTLVFAGAAVAYLMSLETRRKRRRALAAIHELRSLAHIVDMHQLTKDPERAVPTGPETDSSPERGLSAFELGRYLDYCSEMLALISKVGALYVQGFEDAIAVTAVDEIEDLTTGLSRKIWQKIQVLEQRDRGG